MERGDREHKSAADKYLLSGDPRKEQQVSLHTVKVLNYSLGERNRGLSKDFLRINEVDRELDNRFAVPALTSSK